MGHDRICGRARNRVLVRFKGLGLMLRIVLDYALGRRVCDTIY